MMSSLLASGGIRFEHRVDTGRTVSSPLPFHRGCVRHLELRTQL